MKLDTYLNENDLTETDFGRRIGLSQSQVNRIRNDKSWPSKGIMERIASATNGAVTANDFVDATETAA